MALFRNIYLRFEGLVAEYKHPQDRMAQTVTVVPTAA